MIPAKGKQELSCKRCRYRKLRCTRTSPCGNCATAGVSCEYEKTDKRRNPPSSEYTDGLRNRVASLEAFIQDLKDASPTRRDEMLGTVAFTPTPTAGPSQVTQSETPTIAHLKPDVQGSLI
ncbi:hypothetical protein QX201_003969 [Fusarium graminearum]